MNTKHKVAEHTTGPDLNMWRPGEPFATKTPLSFSQGGWGFSTCYQMIMPGLSMLSHLRKFTGYQTRLFFLAHFSAILSFC